MDKRTKEEREFAESIDRLLTDEEVTASEEMNEDYRTAVNFARKLTEFRANPSPQFKDQLKQRLLLKLTQQEVVARQEEEAKSFWEFLRNLVPQNPAWRTAVATLVVVLVAAGVLWRVGMFTQAPVLEGLGGEGAEVRAPVPVPALGVEMEAALQPLLELEAVPLEPTVFPFGNTVTIVLAFKNSSSELITVTPFPPAAHIVGSRTIGPVHSFAEGDDSLELSASEIVSHTLIWDQRDSSGEQVAPGWYNVYAGEVTIYKDTEPAETHLSFGTLTHLLIQHPQGAMEKVIELDLTETAGGLSITLEQVELHNQGVIFSAFTTPPDYSPPQDSKSHPLKGLIPALAEYTVDGVTIQAKYSELMALEDGIRMTWGRGESYLNPVPSDATKLVFRIISFGDWQGPWEFMLPLQD